MSIQSTSLFQNFQHALARDQKKIEIISDNISRAQLPHAKTKVLKESTFGQMVKGSSGSFLKTTDPRHIGGGGSSTSFKVATQKPKAGEVSLTGNAINPQDELRKLNETYTKSYETQTQYSNFVKRFKTILGAR